MRVREKIAIVLSIAVFVFIFGLLCWPIVCVIRLFGWLSREPEGAIRSRVARYAHWWGSVVFFLVVRLLRLDVRVTMEGEKSLIHDRTCIMIANHQSTLDIAVITWLAQQLGLGNARWIMKQPLRNVPVIGWIAQRTGCAFVSRNRDSGDIEAIKFCARILREDNAAVILFPEGTRFTKAQATAEFSHVLPPKKTGFALLRKALPDAPVVTVTLQWMPPVVDGSRGKTIFQAADFYGKSLSIKARIVTAYEVRNDERWLERDWQAKDRLLATFV